MIYRTYGQTGIEVSAIGCGGMRFRNQEDVDQSAALVKAAYDAGINYFDTAIGYGNSEDILGVAFKEMQKTRDEKPFYIATKSKQHEPDGVRRDVETSLKRLGVECIDFYHAWCVMSLEDYNSRKAKGALREFEKLKEEGLIKHIAVSTHMAGDDIGTMLDDYPFEGVLMGYCAMNFSFREKGLDTAARLGRGVAVMNPLGGGVIPQNPDRFSFVRTRDNESVVEGALRFLLNDNRITVTLVGLSDEKQLAEAVAAVDGFEPIAEDKISGVRASLKESYNQLCTGCQYCDSCPVGIPIPKMMDAYNHNVVSDGQMDAINRLSWDWEIQPDSEIFGTCIECGQCEELCTQKLPIIERLKELDAAALRAREKE